MRCWKLIYGKYKNARDAAWQCLIDNKVSSLPVKVNSIATANDITIIKYSDVDHRRLSDGESGVTCFAGDDIYIIYRDTEPVERCRFTIAHELGHILLGHRLIGDRLSRKFDLTKPESEQEADIFASRLLAPACVLWGLNLHTADEIAAVCNISMSAAQTRAERMQVLYKRNKFLTSSLERQVYKQFEDYIKSKK